MSKKKILNYKEGWIPQSINVSKVDNYYYGYQSEEKYENKKKIGYSSIGGIAIVKSSIKEIAIMLISIIVTAVLMNTYVRELWYATYIWILLTVVGMILAIINYFTFQKIIIRINNYALEDKKEYVVKKSVNWYFSLSTILSYSLIYISLFSIFGEHTGYIFGGVYIFYHLIAIPVAKLYNPQDESKIYKILISIKWILTFLFISFIILMFVFEPQYYDYYFLKTKTLYYVRAAGIGLFGLHVIISATAVTIVYRQLDYSHYSSSYAHYISNFIILYSQRILLIISWIVLRGLFYLMIGIYFVLQIFRLFFDK